MVININHLNILMGRVNVKKLIESRGGWKPGRLITLKDIPE